MKDLCELFEQASSREDWKLTMGTAYDAVNSEVLVCAKLELLECGREFYAVSGDPVSAMKMVLSRVSETIEFTDFSKEETDALMALKETLDEVGFDNAISLLEKIKNM